MKLLSVLAALPFLALLHAVVIRTLWGWFVVPLGVPDVGYAHAYGIAIIMTALTYQHDWSDRKTGLPEVVIVAIVRAVLSLSFGWIALQFMGA